MNYEELEAETVAALLGKRGISVRQLRNYCDQGCPFEQRGRERVFNWYDVLDWYVAFKAGGMESAPGPDAPNPNQPRDQRQENLRKTIAEADLKELQLARLRGEVIVTADARIKLDRLMGNLRSRLLSLPAKVSARISGMKEASARETAIREELEIVCQELATGSVVDLPPEPEPEPRPEEAIDLEASADTQPTFNDDDFGLA